MTLERKPQAPFPETPSGLSQQDGLGTAAGRGERTSEENVHLGEELLLDFLNAFSL